MQDMLVRLWKLPDSAPLCAALASRGIIIRRCNPFEKHILTHWVRQCFSPKWVSESEIAMGRQPASCLIATCRQAIVGFACYDATARGFVGPMGVEPSMRGTGVGKALLVSALSQMKALGYAYAIIGGVGPKEFYAKCVGATLIEDSSPGIYDDILPDPPSAVN